MSTKERQCPKKTAESINSLKSLLLEFRNVHLILNSSVINLPEDILINFHATHSALFISFMLGLIVKALK
jgi:hypothetical protein